MQQIVYLLGFSMSYLLCSACKGKKRVEGIGYTKKDCTGCGGTGILDKATDIKEENILTSKVSKRKEKIVEPDV